jgi:hypothetical protein
LRRCLEKAIASQLNVQASCVAFEVFRWWQSIATPNGFEVLFGKKYGDVSCKFLTVLDTPVTFVKNISVYFKLYDLGLIYRTDLMVVFC